jgi:DNA-directed RNA polymerase specialized sigma24 family protein
VPRRPKGITRQGDPIQPPLELQKNLGRDNAEDEGEPSTASNINLETNFFGRIAKEAAGNLAPTQPAKLTDEEEARSWRKTAERYTLRNNVKKLEEQVEKLQRRGLRGGRRKMKLTKEQFEQLHRAGLTERQVQVILLRIEYAMKPAEIARKLGIDSSTVREHLSVAHQKMDKFRSPRNS